MEKGRADMRFQASCPLCGRVLLRATTDSVVEIYCPKCKNLLRISFEASGFTAELVPSVQKSELNTVC